MPEAPLGALSECLSAFMRHLYDSWIISDNAVEHCVSLLRKILNIKKSLRVVPPLLTPFNTVAIILCYGGRKLLSDTESKTCSQKLPDILHLHSLHCCSCNWTLQQSSTCHHGMEVCCSNGAVHDRISEQECFFFFTLKMAVWQNYWIQFNGQSLQNCR